MVALFKRFASIITVPAVLLMIYWTGRLILDFNTLHEGEGWGVLFVLPMILLSIILLGIGMAIRYFIKNAGGRLAIEILLFLIILLSVSEYF